MGLQTDFLRRTFQEFRLTGSYYMTCPLYVLPLHHVYPHLSSLPPALPLPIFLSHVSFGGIRVWELAPLGKLSCVILKGQYEQESGPGPVSACQVRDP